ncbi:MAG TPA: glycosyl hydrolase family 28-related protein [Acidimicrobiales bacterium]|nr:glycosyl hydrolase family 28-related protein [Acidimicrobiales bacterium]
MFHKAFPTNGGLRFVAFTAALLSSAATVIGTGAPPAAAATVTPDTAGAVSVRSYGAVGDGSRDDTAAFLKAQDAALKSTLRYSPGPTGAPQAVVYVPPGTYRLIRLPFRSNVRMEVDAGAVLEQAGGRYVSTKDNVAALMVWDGPGRSPLTNVTLTGVNQSTGGVKASADPVASGWSIAPDFTFNLDPATTDASVKVAGVQALNVTGFLIENVFSIQNDSQPATVPTTDDGWWPSTRKAALGLKERADTPADGSVFYDPHNGTVSNWYNIHGPKGFGPNQVNAGHQLQFHHIFSQGGTALRLETDASQGKSFAAELRGVTADDINGLNCNRAVSFSPHSQFNYDVNVTNVRAVNCAQGVVESIDETNKWPAGAFVNSTIANVSVTGGAGAQLGTNPNGPWTVGTSQKAFAKDKSRKATWSVAYAAGTFSCRGTFQSTSDLIKISNGLVAPVCQP